jgi:hypothetical protein
MFLLIKLSSLRSYVEGQITIINNVCIRNIDMTNLSMDIWFQAKVKKELQKDG